MIVEARWPAGSSPSGRMPPHFARRCGSRGPKIRTDGAHIDIARIAIVGMAIMLGRPIDPGRTSIRSAPSCRN